MKEKKCLICQRILNFVEKDAMSTEDYIMCYNCRNLSENHYTIIGVSNKPLYPDQKPIANNLYPTGNNLIVQETIIHLLFANKKELHDKILENKGLYLNDEIVLNLIELVEKINEKSKTV